MWCLYELRKSQESNITNSGAFAETGQHEENCLTYESGGSGVRFGHVIFMRTLRYARSVVRAELM